jgi:hypothetical protein
MSRARSITYEGEQVWFDCKKNSGPARVEDLETLAAVEEIEIDDLLDEGLNQGAVITRLRDALGQGTIPEHVLIRARERKIQQETAPECRLCSLDGQACEGKITRHHFVTRWLMKELENYEAYARRDRCTIPVCMGRHRNLHMRTEEDKSIVTYLNETERKFAHKMLSELEEQHPRIMDLARAGDPSLSYEARLVRDYDEGKFSHEYYNDIRDDIPYMGKDAGNFVRKTIEGYDPSIKLPNVI